MDDSQREAMREKLMVLLDTSFDDYNYPSPKGPVSAFELFIEDALALYEQGCIEAHIDEANTIWSRWAKGPDHKFSEWVNKRVSRLTTLLTKRGDNA